MDKNTFALSLLLSFAKFDNGLLIFSALNLGFLCLIGSLIDGLIEVTNKNISFSGVGGPLMESAGFNSLFKMSDLSLMGLIEIIPKIPMLISRIRLTTNSIISENPDVLITIDSPDFCMRVAKKVRKALPNIKIIHYVAPSVWAWRPERAAKMSKYVDHVVVSTDDNDISNIAQIL